MAIATLKRQTATGPKPIGEYPEVQAAQAKLDEILRELSVVDHEIVALRTDATAGQSIEEQARRYLAGEGLRDGDAERMRDLRQRGAVLRAAADMQALEVGNVQGLVSRRIAEAMLPEYRRMLSEMAEAAVKLGQIADEEQRFRDELIRFDIKFAGVMRPVGLQEMRLAMPGTMLNRWLDEVEEYHGVRTKVARAGDRVARAPDQGRG